MPTPGRRHWAQLKGASRVRAAHGTVSSLLTIPAGAKPGLQSEMTSKLARRRSVGPQKPVFISLVPVGMSIQKYYPSTGLLGRLGTWCAGCYPHSSEGSRSRAVGLACRPCPPALLCSARQDSPAESPRLPCLQLWAHWPQRLSGIAHSFLSHCPSPGTA